MYVCQGHLGAQANGGSIFGNATALEVGSTIGFQHFCQVVPHVLSMHIWLAFVLPGKWV